MSISSRFIPANSFAEHTSTRRSAASALPVSRPPRSTGGFGPPLMRGRSCESLRLKRNTTPSESATSQRSCRRVRPSAVFIASTW